MKPYFWHIGWQSPSPTLQFEKSIFDKMPQLIDILIIIHQAITTFPRWNGGLDAIFPEVSYRRLSYPLSARRYSAVIPSTNLQACEQSATVPAVTDILTGIPCCASTARCIFELSPLLCVPCPDYHRLLL